jgi:hypothetical protein
MVVKRKLYLGVVDELPSVRSVPPVFPWSAESWRAFEEDKEGARRVQPLGHCNVVNTPPSILGLHSARISSAEEESEKASLGSSRYLMSVRLGTSASTARASPAARRAGAEVAEASSPRFVQSCPGGLGSGRR